MPDRMSQLQAMLAREPNDPFLLYALALEHKKANDFPPALQLLEKVIQIDPGYCYAYFQTGQIKAASGDVAGARDILQRGVNAAVRKADSKAQGELLAALD